MVWDAAFSYTGPADIFREHAALSAFENDGARMFNLGALAELDDAAYDHLPPVQWPPPKPGRGPSGTRLFGRGGFPTPDGRARMIALSPSAGEASQEFPLTLNTGRVRDQWHTMTRTGRVPYLMTHAAAPALAVHPRDAAARGIINRGLARIESAQGAVVMRVSLDEDLRPGDAFAPMHWTNQFLSCGPIDRLVHAMTDPVSGQPDLKGTPVRVSAVPESWRGNLYRLASGNPEFSESVWWAMAQISAGFGFELSGTSPLAEEVHSEAVLRRLLHIPADAELVSYSDARKGTFRYAGIVHGRLTGCAFFGPPGSGFSGLEQAKILLGKEISAVDRIALLARLDSSGSKKAGKTVRACFSVSEDSICVAIRDDGLRSPAEIGKALKAGTNCGSCVPEIKKLITSQLPTPVT